MEAVEFNHVSVLLNECIEGLNIRDGYTYIDCTTGGGGHSLEIVKKLGPNSRLICIDRDEDALAAAKERLKEYLDKITFVHTNFENLGVVLDSMQIDNFGGFLADLGCSSYQFDNPDRGFSYMQNAPLDMRMDSSDNSLSAYDVVNTYSEENIKRILFEYGEEKFSAKIAHNIILARANKPIETTYELSDIIKKSIPSFSRNEGPHPAKRSFQAIRIEVNHELDSIAPAIEQGIQRLAPSGRCVIISFHSLEDRIVKNTYAKLSSGCTCPRDFPICVCGKKPIINYVNKKPILPTPVELESNPRSRSAKLRIAEKI